MLRTFIPLNESGFEAHARQMLDQQSTSEKKKEVAAYIKHVLAIDRASIDSEREITRRKIREQRRRQRAAEKLVENLQLDFSRTPALFQPQTLTSAEIDSRLAQDNTETFLRANYSGTINITGDNVLLAGTGTRGLAASDLLSNSYEIAGDIVVSGSNVTLRDLTIRGQNVITSMKEY